LYISFIVVESSPGPCDKLMFFFATWQYLLFAVVCNIAMLL